MANTGAVSDSDQSFAGDKTFEGQVAHSKALKLKSYTTTQRDALAAPELAAGVVVFNSSTGKLNFYNGSAWEAVTSA